MDVKLQKFIQKQFKDFVENRADEAALSLKANREYLQIESRYNKLFKELCEISTEKHQYAFEADDIITGMSNHLTVAAYKQGFADAMALGGINHGVFFYGAITKDKAV